MIAFSLGNRRIGRLFSAADIPLEAQIESSMHFEKARSGNKTISLITSLGGGVKVYYKTKIRSLLHLLLVAKYLSQCQCKS